MLPNIKRGSGIGKTVQVAFGGLDLRPEAADGTFCQVEKMTADRYPFLTVRDRRKEMTVAEITPEAVLGMGDALLSWKGGELYYNDFLLCKVVPSQRKRMVPFGMKVVIPDSRRLVDLTYPLKGHVDEVAELPAQPDEGDAYTVGGYSAPRIYLYRDAAWTDVGPVITRLEVSVSVQAYGCCFPAVGKYQGEDAEWNTIRLPASAGDLREKFKAGDAVTISGCTAQPKNNQTIIVREVQEHELRFYEDSFEQAWLWKYEIKRGGIVFELDERYEAVAEELPDSFKGKTFVMDAETLQGIDYDAEVKDLLILWKPKLYDPSELTTSIIFGFFRWDAEHETYIQYAGFLAADKPAGADAEPISFEKTDHHPVQEAAGGIVRQYYEDSAVTVSRLWPVGLEGVFADSNRLWGWEGHTLRASKLGDPGNWSFFDGTAEDSWALDVHTPDAFTGGISAHGYPTFYTAHKRFRIYGSEPETYQLAEQECQGVKAGCQGSMATVAGTLYYLSEAGVTADDGTIPTLASAALGTFQMQRGAVAAACGWKYLLSGNWEGYGPVLLTLDVRNGTWMREFRFFSALTRVGSTAYGVEQGVISATIYYKLWKFDQTNATESALQSVLETNDFTMQQPNRKRVHRIQLRMVIGSGASLTVSIQHDGGSWVQVAQLSGDNKKKSVYLPVLPRRCDHFRLRFEGSGVWELQSLALETRVGSAGF